MARTRHDFLRSCISLMVRPIAHFCVSRGVRFQDFLELSKKNFVDAAERQLRHEQREVSHSRVSVMTGLQRPEVKRLLADKSKVEPKDIVTRLLGYWERDRRFVDGRGRPKQLSVQGNNCEFAKLVNVVSKDLNPHTVRFELERLGLVAVVGDKAKLLQKEFLSHGDPQQALRFGSEDVHDLLIAVEENAFLSSQTANLHARTQYDNIPDEFIPKIKESLLELGRSFNAKARDLLAPFDKDLNPKIAKAEGRNRVVVGTFSRTHVADEQGEKE